MRVYVVKVLEKKVIIHKRKILNNNTRYIYSNWIKMYNVIALPVRDRYIITENKGEKTNTHTNIIFIRHDVILLYRASDWGWKIKLFN